MPEGGMLETPGGDPDDVPFAGYPSFGSAAGCPGALTRILTDVTPDRLTTVRFDITEQICVEGPWGGVRQGAQIASGFARDRGHNSERTRFVRYWPTGCWTLAPLQERMAEIADRIDDLDHTYGAGGALGATIGATVGTMWSKDTLPGVGYGGFVLNTNDRMFRVEHAAASGSWASPIAIAANTQAIGPAGIASIAAPPAVNVDRWLASTADAPADQAFWLRWHMPGVLSDSPDYIWYFTFGQYQLVCCGDGRMMLFERCRDAGSVYRWRHRKTFTYTSGATIRQTFGMAIFPHLGPMGQKYIVFSVTASDVVTPSVRAAGGPPGGSTTQVVYEADYRLRGTDLDEAPTGKVTKAGPVYLDHRRDKRLRFVVQNLRWVTDGELYDDAWTIPVYTTPAMLSLTINRGGGGTLNGTIYDTDTGAATSTTNVPQVRFTFTSTAAGADTPRLFAYSLSRPAQVITSTPGEWSAYPSSVNVSQACPDPRTDRGDVVIDDLTGAYFRLARRGEFRCRVETTFTRPEGGTQQVALFDGYCVMPQRNVIGALAGTDGGAAAGAATLYPNRYHSRYMCNLEGMYRRLLTHNTLTFVQFAIYAEDSTAAVDPVTGQKPPWKVTAVIADILARMGFLPGQIDIPDNPIRLFPGIRTPHTDYLVDSNTNLPDRLVTLARNYLGAYLVWDANHTVNGGAWTLLFPPPIPDARTPVVRFVAMPTPPAPGVVKLPHAWASYAREAAGAWVETFYLPGATSYVEPPEANHVRVMTFPDVAGSGDGIAIEQNYYNPRSAAFPGFSVSPDPDSPHFSPMGERLYVAKDPTLYAGDSSQGYGRTFYAVAFAARRLFERIARAFTVFTIHAPLVFVKDANTGRYRPVRMFDPVTIDGVGGFYVRSCRPTYSNDGVQMAYYELERPEPFTTGEEGDTADTNTTTADTTTDTADEE